LTINNESVNIYLCTAIMKVTIMDVTIMISIMIKILLYRKYRLYRLYR